MEKTCPEVVDLQEWEILPDSNSLLQELSRHSTKHPELLDQPVANTGYIPMKVENYFSSRKELPPAVIPAEEMHTDEEAEYKAMEEEKKDHTGSEPKGKDFGCNWRLTGLGATVAAAICIFIFGGSRQHQKQPQKQKIQFEIYADDKRMKGMVQQARRLNQALSAVRGGAPMDRARISFEGYCANG